MRPPLWVMADSLPLVVGFLVATLAGRLIAAGSNLQTATES